jgi:predicted LPLAT superfamily acyltransferase
MLLPVSSQMSMRKAKCVLVFMGSPTRLARAPHYLYAMLLRPEYLSQELDRPLPTKDGGILRTIRDGLQLHDRHRQAARAA